jgi:hypothetical protein
MKKKINIKIEKNPTKAANFRKAVRRAIQAGSEVYAIVLEVYMNRATVRIEHTNQRLTGLMILGGDVRVGDRVIVDYSHGTPPFIRSSYISDKEKEEEGVEILKNKYEQELVPSMGGAGSWGTVPSFEITYTAAVGINHSLNASQRIQYATPTIIRWGDNQLFGIIWYYCQLWDNTGSIWPYTNRKDPYGSEVLNVPSGKYIVRSYIDFSIPNLYECNPVFHGFTPEKKGWIRLTIYQQGSPIAQVSQRWGAIPSPYNDEEGPMLGLQSHYYSWIGKSISCSVIADVNLANPGMFTVGIEQTVCSNDDFDTKWMFPFQYCTQFSATLIPNTYNQSG